MPIHLLVLNVENDRIDSISLSIYGGISMGNKYLATGLFLTVLGEKKTQAVCLLQTLWNNK